MPRVSHTLLTLFVFHSKISLMSKVVQCSSTLPGTRIGTLCTEYPELHTMVEDYLDLLLQEGVRGKYQSIYMALNASCKPHCDKNNVGLSVVTAVGDFTGGGELAIDPTRERLPCQECFKGKQGARVCRDVIGGATVRARATPCSVRAFGHECPCRRVPRRRLRVGGPLDVVVPAADSGGALRHESIGGGTSNDPIGTSGGAIRWAHLAWREPVNAAHQPSWFP